MNVRILLATFATLFATLMVATQTPAEEAALVKAVRVGTVDFVVGPHAGHCGCPSVMAKNTKHQLVLIVSSQADESLLKLTAALEGVIACDTTIGHVVFLPKRSRRTPEQHAAVCNRVKTLAETAESSAFVWGVRRTSKNWFEFNDIQSDTETAVILLDGKNTVRLWTLKPGETTEEQIASIAAEAKRQLADQAEKLE